MTVPLQGTPTRSAVESNDRSRGVLGPLQWLDAHKAAGRISEDEYGQARDWVIGLSHPTATTTAQAAAAGALPTQRTTSPVQPPPVRPPEGGARFVGDASVLGGPSISRVLNALCYVIAGIGAVVIGPQTEHGWSMIGAIGGGLLAMAYGVKIATTRTSYWVSSTLYLVTIVIVATAVGSVANWF